MRRAGSMIQWMEKLPGRFGRSRNRLSNALRIRAWRIEGAEKHSGKDLAIVYAGLEPQKNYFARMALREGWKEVDWGREWLWLIRGRARRECPACQILVYELNKEKDRFFSFLGLLRSPVWIRFELPLDAGRLTASARVKRKRMYHKIQRNGFTSSISRRESDFNDFYHNMYLPFTRARHGTSAMLHEYHDLKNRFLSAGELVLVLLKGQVIGGTLMDYSNGQGHALYSGLRNGSAAYLKMGAIQALSYFEISRMSERDPKGTANLGHCRAFFSDGVVHYKTDMGARVAPAHLDFAGFLRFRFLRDTDSLRHFLMKNPFVTLEPHGKYSAVVFADCAFSSQRVDDELDFRYCKGLKDVTVYTFNNNSPSSTLTTRGGRRVHLLPASLVVPAS